MKIVSVKYGATIPTKTQYENVQPEVVLELGENDTLADARKVALNEFKVIAETIGTQNSSYLKV